MADYYSENLIEKKGSLLPGMLFIIAGVLAVAGLLLTFFGVIYGFPMFIVGAGICYLCFLIRSIEYEYIFIGGTFEISRILGKSKRKKVFKMELSDVTTIVPAFSKRLDGIKIKEGGLKKKDFSSEIFENRENMFSFITTVKGVKTNVILELSKDTLALLETYAKSKLYKD